MIKTEADLTAWQVWDQEHERLYQLMLDAEQDMHEAQQEVETAEQKIAEHEAHLIALKVVRSRHALQHREHEQKLEFAKRKFTLHAELDPEHD
jgi:hypothetical protein